MKKSFVILSGTGISQSEIPEESKDPYHLNFNRGVSRSF
jgi:hypothetical protein